MGDTDIHKPLERLLFDAVQANDAREVKILIGLGASPNWEDSDGATPLMIAAERADGTNAAAEILEELLAHPRILVNKKADDDETALHRAARRNRVRAVEKLLAMPGIEVDARNDFLSTPLMVAAQNGGAEAAALLLAKSATVNAVDRNGRSAMHYAVSREHLEVLRVLARHGGDAALEDKNGISAITLADGRNMKEHVSSRIAQFLNAAAAQEKFRNGAHVELESPDRAAFKKKPAPKF